MAANRSILTGMIWFWYNVLFTIGFTLLLPRFLWRMVKRGGYRRHFLQRLGIYDAATREALGERQRIWIHAVSVGELYIAFRFMEKLRAREPDCAFVLTTTTSTGHTLARKQMKEPDLLLYFPVDSPWIMQHVLTRVQPRLLVLVECELWPNLVRLCRRRGVAVTLINGRISRKSFRGYHTLRLFTRRLLPLFDLLAVQSAEDRERLLALGAPADRVEVMGSAKYEPGTPDADGEASALRALREAGMGEESLVWVGGSTWPGEEAILLDVYNEVKTRFPALGLVLAPRHAERAPEVLETIAAKGRRVLRRSEVRAGMESADALPDAVLLVDTTGELRHFYAHASIIFVGKSLTQHGGQNVIEAAQYKKPVLVGPNMENFEAVMQEFREADAVCQVRDAEELRTALESLLASPELRTQLGSRAGRLIHDKTGALDRTLDRVMPLAIAREIPLRRAS